MAIKSKKAKPVQYKINVKHWPNGDMEVAIGGVIHDENGVVSALNALQQAGKIIVNNWLDYQKSGKYIH